MEVFSKISIVDFPRHFIGPFSDSSWLIHDLCIPDKPFKVMEGIEGLLRAASGLLDVGELGHVLEPVFAISPLAFPLLVEGASILGVAIDSLIENTLYSGVVFLDTQTPRVEISGNGPPRV